MRFALMLANGGEGNGVRLLSRKTVELMTSDHLGPALSQAPNFAPGPGYGFGLTVAVRTALGLSGYPGSVGEFNWGGFAGRAFWVDPEEKLVPIMLIQAPGQRLYYRFLPAPKYAYGGSSTAGKHFRPWVPFLQAARVNIYNRR